MFLPPSPPLLQSRPDHTAKAGPPSKRAHTGSHCAQPAAAAIAADVSDVPHAAASNMQHGFDKDEHDVLQVMFDMPDAKMTAAAVGCGCGCGSRTSGWGCRCW